MTLEEMSEDKVILEYQIKTLLQKFCTKYNPTMIMIDVDSEKVITSESITIVTNVDANVYF